MEKQTIFVVTPQSKPIRAPDTEWQNQASIVKNDRAGVDRYLKAQRSYFGNMRQLVDNGGYQTRYRVREVQVLSEEFIPE